MILRGEAARVRQSAVDIVSVLNEALFVGKRRHV